jgi:hypothetical protein
MPYIKEAKITANFKYLWLKYVKGFDITEHCAKCLLGEYEKQVSPKGIFTGDLPIAPYYYLCGVSMPFVWANNFHLAFEAKEGSTLVIERNGIVLVIDNAVELEIKPPTIQLTHKKEFTTCRNWQFAVNKVLEQ